MTKDNSIELIRHFLATLAYRFQQAINEAPDGFDHLEAGKGVRTPNAILNHMTHDLLYAKSTLEGDDQRRIEKPSSLNWENEITRFHETLQEIDWQLESNPHEIDILKIILQGPLADVMTHIGQLSMLRRLADSPVKGENFMKSAIKTGKLDEEQELKP